MMGSRQVRDTAIRRFAVLIFLAIAVAVAPYGARAANVAPSVHGKTLNSLKARRKKLFSKMLADPGNVDIALAYARASVRVGDFEGAISTLERVAIFVPDSPALKFELAKLYLRLDSYDMASALFREVQATPSANAAMKNGAGRYLRSITEQTRTDRLHSFVTFGARYQSNANGGVDSPFVDLHGTEFTVNDASLADPDTNGFISAGLHYSHDLADQGDRIDADLNAYGALYADHHEINTLYIGGRVGPVFNLQRFGIPHSELGIYGIAGAMWLKGDPYLGTLGVGTVINADIDSTTHSTTRVEYVHDFYMDSDLRPSVSEMTGDKVRALTSLRHAFTGRFSLYGYAYGERTAAAEDYKSNWEAGAFVGGTVLFAAPVLDRGKPWSFDLGGGLIARRFDDPDPMISADPEIDHEAFAKARLTVPVADTWSMQWTVQYRDITSNYDIDSFDDLSAIVAFRKSF